MRRLVSVLLGFFLALMVAVQPGVAQAAGNASPRNADDLIAQAKAADPSGFAVRLKLVHRSSAFMDVLGKYTSDPELNAEFFAAISTREGAEALVKNTKGKHYVVNGTADAPAVTLVDGAVPKADPGMATNAMPACPKAWAAFSAWLIGTTMLCAPFSGPAAWACAIGMGLLGLMPDFNRACR